jgi:molecular chaperone GrpE
MAKKEKQKEEQETEVLEETKELEQDTKLNNEMLKLEEEIQRLTTENKTLQEKVKLAQAELINYRKRKDEEVSNLLKYSNQDIIMDIISVLDNFDRAININNPSDEVKNFLVGFKMIYNQLVETLKNYGVSELEVLNKPFDSNTCEAVLVDNNNELDNDLVVEVLLKGYKLKDRVIRPAKVKVNKKGND